MRRLVASVIMGVPAPESNESLAASIVKAIAFRAALAFLTASLYPASAAAPTCITDTRGRPSSVNACLLDPPGPPHAPLSEPQPAAD